MALTLHVDASDTGQLFTTFSGTGVHTGTPTDGVAVQVWDDEGDGIADFIMVYPTISSQSPVWRFSTPLMLLPCLDFDGTSHTYDTHTQAGGFGKPLGDFITNAAFTVLIAFYPESITDTGTFETGTCLLGDLGEYWGIFLRDAAGQRKVTCYNWDGNADGVELDISQNSSYVLMWRHESGNLYASLNGAAESSPVASGNTTIVGYNLAMGKTPSSTFYNGRIGELKIWNDGNANGNLAAEITTMTSKWLPPTGPSVGELAAAARGAMLPGFLRRGPLPVVGV